MSPADTLQAAIDRLERLRDETVQSGEVSIEAVTTALRMIPSVCRILRNDLALIEASEGARLERVLDAAERAGDLALATAIVAPSPSPVVTA